MLTIIQDQVYVAECDLINNITACDHFNPKSFIICSQIWLQKNRPKVHMRKEDRTEKIGTKKLLVHLRLDYTMCDFDKSTPKSVTMKVKSVIKRRVLKNLINNATKGHGRGAELN